MKMSRFKDSNEEIYFMILAFSKQKVNLQMFALI